MGKREWIVIAVVSFMAVGSMIGTALMGGVAQVRCVGVDSTGVVVKGFGEQQCSELDQVVYTELGPDGQIRYSGAETVEFGP